jgi:hypothetical protein
VEGGTICEVLKRACGDFRVGGFLLGGGGGRDGRRSWTKGSGVIFTGRCDFDSSQGVEILSAK